MRILPAALEDIAVISAIAGDNPYSAPWGEEGFAGEIKQSCARVYKFEDSAGTVRGFICYRVVAPVAELTNFAVDRNFLKRGAASALLGYSLPELAKEGVKEITLEVNVNNISAVGLYKKFGFETVSYRKKFYNNTEDAALMRKIL